MTKTEYLEYLLGEKWRKKAERARARNGYRCQLCNSGGKLHVHHRCYDRLGKELLSDLTVLCEDCHEKFHFTQPTYSQDLLLKKIKKAVDGAQAAYGLDTRASVRLVFGILRKHMEDSSGTLPES